MLTVIYYTVIIFMLSYSFQIIYRVSNFFHILHASIITLGAYVTYFISIQCSLSLFLAIPISILFCIGLILIVNKYIYKPLVIRNVEKWQLLVVSLGLYLMLQNIVSIIWGDSILSLRTWPIKVGHNLFGFYITDVQIITIAVSIALLVLSWLLIEKTNIGKQIKAVSSNSNLSNYFGISTNKAVMYSFILGSVLASMAGILIAADTDMTPIMGFNWLLYAVVAMIIGGMGRIRYLFMGALLLATAQHLSAYYLDSKWMNATAYIILIVFLFFKPYGFSGKKLKKTEL